MGVQCPGTRGGDSRKTEEEVEASQLPQGPRSRGRGVGTAGSGCQALLSAERTGEGGYLMVIISRGGGSGLVFLLCTLLNWGVWGVFFLNGHIFLLKMRGGESQRIASWVFF